MVFFMVSLKNTLNTKYSIQYTILNFYDYQDWVELVIQLIPKNCELPWKLEIQFMADLDLGYPSKDKLVLEMQLFILSKRG